MDQATFLAVIDEVPATTTQFVVCLGRPAILPDLPGDRMLVVDDVTPDAVDRLGLLDARKMAGGLVVVTTRAAYGHRPGEVLRAQKLLACLYMKYVQLPAQSTRIPDPLGLRSDDRPPEYLHLLNQYQNAPFHLRHGLIDKLSHEAVGMPCLLLLPGPSLRRLAPHLRELAKRYLIVTISRVLPFLRACAVEPDILVQLDTVPLQEHFHHPDDRFPRSILLSLSMAPIRSFAPRFRRLFFIDSFNLSVLPNASRVRESWLSSLLPCLGCAEALHAPTVLLAGADLRLTGDDVYYSDGGDGVAAGFPPYDLPLAGDGAGVTFADAAGRQANTTLQYFATAGEAEVFAREIQAAQGTVFHSLSSWSILDPAVYPFLSPDAALAAPELDKDRFLAKADAAASRRERVALRSLRALYSRHVSDARRSLEIMACLKISDPEAIRHHPCYRYVADNLPWFRPASEEGLRLLAAKLAEQMYEATRFARNVATLHVMASRGAAIPVLCTAEEEAVVLARLKRLWPDWSWRCLGILAVEAGRPEPSAGSVALGTVYDWLCAQDAVVLAPGCAREFDYALSLVAGENVIDLEALLAYAPECPPPGPAGDCGA
jgi:hypothetical protein